MKDGVTHLDNIMQLLGRNTNLKVLQMIKSVLASRDSFRWRAVIP